MEKRFIPRSKNPKYNLQWDKIKFPFNAGFRVDLNLDTFHIFTRSLKCTRF